MRLLTCCTAFLLALPSPVTAAPTDPDLPNRYLGGLAGGSGFAQLTYQHRLIDPLLVEVGGLLVPALGNASISGILELLPASPVVPYVAAGPAVAFACGQSTEEDPETGELTDRADCQGGFFITPRTGASITLCRDRACKLSVDGGLWYDGSAWGSTYSHLMLGVGFYAQL